MFNICTALCTAKDGASDSLSDCWKCEQHITEWNITWLMTHAAPCVLNIYYYYYRQAAQRAAAGIVFTHELRGRFFGFFFAPAAKLLTGPKNHWTMKWWHGPPLPSCRLVEIAQRTSVWGDKVFVVFVSRLRNSTTLVHNWVNSTRHSIGICRPI